MEAGGRVSTGDREDTRRAREELMRIEERRLGLSKRVMRGEPEALKEDWRLEARLRELAQWFMRVETRISPSLEKLLRFTSARPWRRSGPCEGGVGQREHATL